MYARRANDRNGGTKDWSGDGDDEEGKEGNPVRSVIIMVILFVSCVFFPIVIRRRHYDPFRSCVSSRAPARDRHQFTIHRDVRRRSSAYGEKNTGPINTIGMRATRPIYTSAGRAGC